MKNDEKIVPVYASSFFSLAQDGEFHQMLQYDYYDPDRYYANLKDEEFSAEVKKLWGNMQDYLEEETNKVNGKLVYPEVKICDIQFRGRAVNPFIMWLITFKGMFKTGINVYETITDEEELEYDCYATWQFPEKTEIKEVESKLYFDIFGSRIILWAEKGMRIGGFERIRFELG
jgi:hypothetical protein